MPKGTSTKPARSGKTPNVVAINPVIWEEIKRNTRPFETVADVLMRLLGLAEEDNPVPSNGSGKSAKK